MDPTIATMRHQALWEAMKRHRRVARMRKRSLDHYESFYKCVQRVARELFPDVEVLPDFDRARWERTVGPTWRKQKRRQR
jgi:hypothetical protein